MAEVTVYEVVDVGEDRLVVRGTVDGEKAEATGWVSALTNHFDAKDYGEDGHLVEKATAREMTAAEKRAYCVALLAVVGEEKPVAGIKLDDPPPEPEVAEEPAAE